MDITTIFNSISQIIISIFFAIIVIGIVYRLCKNVFSKEIIVDSVVFDKHTTSTRHLPSGKTTTKYIVVFDCKDKTISFFTSFWVFDSVKIGEKGILTYKGNRFISFD